MIEPMSDADAAAVAVIVMTPVLLGTRALVRRSRGQPFTSDEMLTAVGVIAVALVAIALTRRPSVAVLLPAALTGFGLLLVVQSRSQPVSGSVVGMGYAAIAAGVLGLMLTFVRTILG